MFDSLKEMNTRISTLSVGFLVVKTIISRENLSLKNPYAIIFKYYHWGKPGNTAHEIY